MIGLGQTKASTTIPKKPTKPNPRAPWLDGARRRADDGRS